MLYGMASAGTVAWVMYQKFCNGLPYYRQEKDWKQYGVEITRATIRGSRMDKAVTYIQNRRSYLSTYLEDGRCSFSNNLSENAIRPFTVGRKNWLFCDTPNGAQASAIVYTMVEMAKANGVNVYHYLTYLLEKLPDDRMSDDELELLVPWNETVKAEIERRANESNQSYVNCQGVPATEK